MKSLGWIPICPPVFGFTPFRPPVISPVYTALPTPNTDENPKPEEAADSVKGAGGRQDEDYGLASIHPRLVYFPPIRPLLGGINLGWRNISTI